MTCTELWAIIYSDEQYRAYCKEMKGTDAAKYMGLAQGRINELHIQHQVPFNDIHGNLYHWETGLPIKS